MKIYQVMYDCDKFPIAQFSTKQLAEQYVSIVNTRQEGLLFCAARVEIREGELDSCICESGILWYFAVFFRGNRCYCEPAHASYTRESRLSEHKFSCVVFAKSHNDACSFGQMEYEKFKKG
jgi:hypothetical protein